MAKKYQITFDSDTEQSVVEALLTQAGFTATVESLEDDRPASVGVSDLMPPTANTDEAKTAEQAA